MTESLLLRDGQGVSADPKLDWIPSKVPTNRNFLAAELLERPRTAVPVRNGWQPWTGQDQGQEGACCLFGCAHRLNGSPNRRRAKLLAPELFEHYHQVQHTDEWDGCSLGMRCPIQPSPDAMGGTSLNATAHYARNMGWIESWWWVGAGSGDVGRDIALTLLHEGSIVFGVPWSPSMYHPRPDGLLEIDDSVWVGGHCLQGFELSKTYMRSLARTVEGVWMQQSWGLDHGVPRRGWAGCVFVPLDELVTKLMDRDDYWAGEGVVYREVAA